MTKIKDILKWLAATLFAILGIVLIFLKLKQKGLDSMDLEQNELIGDEGKIDDKIGDIDLGADVPDLSDTDVSEYWKDLK